MVIFVTHISTPPPPPPPSPPQQLQEKQGIHHCPDIRIIISILGPQKEAFIKLLYFFNCPWSLSKNIAVAVRRCLAQLLASWFYFAWGIYQMTAFPQAFPNF